MKVYEHKFKLSIYQFIIICFDVTQSSEVAMVGSENCLVKRGEADERHSHRSIHLWAIGTVTSTVAAIPTCTPMRYTQVHVCVHTFETSRAQVIGDSILCTVMCTCRCAEHML